MKITLKGDVVREFADGMTAGDIAKEISMGLFRNATAAMLDGKVIDLRTEINHDAKLDILTFDDEEGKRAYWHTTSHLLAQAVKRLYPDVKLAIGPAIDRGFYYDFDTDTPFTAQDLEKLEAEIKKIIKENLPIERFELPSEEAIKLMEDDFPILSF